MNTNQLKDGMKWQSKRNRKQRKRKKKERIVFEGSKENTECIANVIVDVAVTFIPGRILFHIYNKIEHK